MSFTTTKCRLQLNYRISALACETLRNRDQQQAHPLRNVGPGEELLGILIFFWRGARRHLSDIRGEFRLFESAFQNIFVGARDLTPRF